MKTSNNILNKINLTLIEHKQLRKWKHKVLNQWFMKHFAKIFIKILNKCATLSYDLKQGLWVKECIKYHQIYYPIYINQWLWTYTNASETFYSIKSSMLITLGLLKKINFSVKQANCRLNWYAWSFYRLMSRN